MPTMTMDNTENVLDNAEEKTEVKVKTEPESDGEDTAVQVKTEPDSNEQETAVKVKIEPVNDEKETEIKVKTEPASDGEDTTVCESEFITEAMVKEEKKLHEDTIKEAESFEHQREESVKDIDEEIKEQRFKRLQFLLSKSNMYTEYLLNRMEQQTKLQEVKDEKQKDAVKVNGQVEESKKTDETLTDVSNVKKTRKRKREKSAKFQISDYFNEAANRAKRQKTMEESEKKIEEVEDEGPKDQPRLLTGGTLRKYQLHGFKWLKVLYENGVNGILADEMGLGKTIQCIAIVSHLVDQGIPGPFLVCAPLSTIPNWLSEFKRFAPNVPVVLYHGSKDEREKLRRQIFKLHTVEGNLQVRPVVITSYEIAMSDRPKINSQEWRYIIVDEGHRIKNYKCRLIRELKMYRSTHRLLLTGTPLQNNLSELWSLLNFLLPEIFDDLGSFEAWFDIDTLESNECQEQVVVQEQKKQVLSMLHQILAPFLLRRLKSDVELLIPPKREILVYAPLTKTQKDFYSHTVNKTIEAWINKKNGVEEEKIVTTENGRSARKKKKQVDYSVMLEDEKTFADKKEEEEDIENWVKTVIENTESRNGTSEQEKKKNAYLSIKMQNIMMQLRKCCNHPYLIEHPLDTKTGELLLDKKVHHKAGKLLLMDKMLPELKAENHKVLIFSQMTKMLDILEDYLEVKKFKYCRLDGSMKWEDRQSQMDQFNTDPETFIFLLSTRAGGLGINLIAADTVIIYDSDWNPQSDLQAQDRCHRIGQTKPVMIYRLVTANTVDQKIVERAAAKRRLEKMVIHKGKFKAGIKGFDKSLSAVSPEELVELLKSNDYHSRMSGGTEDSVISDKDLHKLLDRSELSEKWHKMKQGEKIKDTVLDSPLEETDTQPAFKIVDEETGKTGLETDQNENNSMNEDKNNVKRTVADILFDK